MISRTARSSESAIHFTRGDVEDKPKISACSIKLIMFTTWPASAESVHLREYKKPMSGAVAMMEAMRDAEVKQVVLASSGRFMANTIWTGSIGSLLPGHSYAVSCEMPKVMSAPLAVYGASKR
jgi:UDP-glucose 4-epimerase